MIADERAPNRTCVIANPLILKLDAVCELTVHDRVFVEQLCKRSRIIAADQDLTHDDDLPKAVHLILDGFVCRYRLMPDGGRQITALFVPGDICDLDTAILGQAGQPTATLSPCVMAEIPCKLVLELMVRYEHVNRALWWTALTDAAIQSEWIASLGRHSAEMRMAHFLCETLLRLRRVGLADGDSCPMPLSQTDLGDVLGITNVHVNRTLRDLRDAGLVTLRSRRLDIHDLDRLMALCDFDARYLHLNGLTYL